jgi:hypothetical protein
MTAQHSTTAISTSIELSDSTHGALTITDDATVTLAGHHDGSITLEGASLTIDGSLDGTLVVGSLSTATLAGEFSGTLEIKVAGTFVIEEGGRFTGTVSNYGSFTNRGYRSGVVEGRTPDDQPGARVVDPPTGPAAHMLRTSEQ